MSLKPKTVHQTGATRDGRASLNSERSALQVKGCDPDQVTGHYPLREDQLKPSFSRSSSRFLITPPCPGGFRSSASFSSGGSPPIDQSVRKPPKRRAWRKLHLAVDASTGEIVASDPTSRRTRDGARGPVLLEQIDDPLASVSADGAYDGVGVYEAAQDKGEGRAVRVLIPPGRKAQLSTWPSAALEERSRNIRSIRDLDRRDWHTRSGSQGCPTVTEWPDHRSGDGGFVLSLRILQSQACTNGQPSNRPSTSSQGLHRVDS
ncbi:MAG: transposase [Gemmatimonadota bacterium]|nr:MAG: transposase [Gemmatimonadota bacterium]